MSAVGAPPIKSLSLGPPRSSHLPLLTSCSTATAATSDGRTVHIQSSSSLLSYRLPSRAILISFVHDHLLAVTTTGDVFKLPISPADGKKRARESPRRAAIPASETHRLLQLGLLAAARRLDDDSLLVFGDDGARHVDLTSRVVTACPALDDHHLAAPAVLPISSHTVAPALFHAITGGTDALLLASADEAGALRCATIDELRASDSTTPSSASSPPLLAALGEPAAAILACAADTLVVLGARGALLTLSADKSGELRRELFRLPKGTAILGGCTCGQQLLILTSSGVYAYRTAAAGTTTTVSSAATAAADAAAKHAALAAGGFRSWSSLLDHHPSSSASAADAVAPPEPLLAPLPIAPLPLAAVAYPPSADHNSELRLCVLDIGGTLRTVTLPERLLLPPDASASSSTADSGGGGIEAQMREEIDCYLGGHTERSLRERLKRIGEGSAQLAAQQALLAKADAKLAARVHAHAALRALATACAGTSVVRLSPDGSKLLLLLRNPTERMLSDGWCAVVSMARDLPLGDTSASSAGAMEAGYAEAVSGSETLCLPLGGLPSKSEWELEVPLPSFAWHEPMHLQACVCFRPNSDEETTRRGKAGGGSACAMVHVEELLLHRLLRPKGKWQPATDTSDVGVLTRLRSELSEQPTSGRAKSGGDAAAIATTHCKLRLHARSAHGGEARSAADVLRALLGGERCGSSNSGGSRKQANAAFELPGGVGASLRLNTEAGGGSSGAGGSMLLLMQSDEPAALWSLRAALLHQLSRPPPPAPLPTEPAARAAALSALSKEVAALLPQLRKWQLAHMQLHGHVHRCFELRRRFDRGSASVSLRELSLEVAHQCKRSLELHQAIRGSAGCPPLCL